MRPGCFSGALLGGLVGAHQGKKGTREVGLGKGKVESRKWRDCVPGCMVWVFGVDSCCVHGAKLGLVVERAELFQQQFLRDVFVRLINIRAEYAPLPRLPGCWSAARVVCNVIKPIYKYTSTGRDAGFLVDPVLDAADIDRDW